MWFPRKMTSESDKAERRWKPIWPTSEGSDDPEDGWTTPWPPMAPTALGAVAEILDQIERDDRRSDTPFLVGTAAFWLVALHEGHRDRDPIYDQTRMQDPDGRVLDGLTLARNAVAHGQVIVARSRGMEWPLVFPIEYGPWVWPESKEWPWRPKRTKHLATQQASYVEHFANRLVGEPLRRALTWLARPHKIGDATFTVGV
jgi:hypothetical protein